MTDRQIVCVDCGVEGPVRKHVSQIGYLEGSKPVQLRYREDVIADIKAGIKYFVEVGNAKVKVLIQKEGGMEYLKTNADWTPDDNLLSLARCTALPAYTPNRGPHPNQGGTASDPDSGECDDGSGVPDVKGSDDPGDITGAGSLWGQNDDPGQ